MEGKEERQAEPSVNETLQLSLSLSHRFMSCRFNRPYRYPLCQRQMKSASFPREATPGARGYDLLAFLGMSDFMQDGDKASQNIKTRMALTLGFQGGSKALCRTLTQKTTDSIC